MRMLLTLAAVWMLMGCMTAFAQESDGQLPNGKSVYTLSADRFGSQRYELERKF